MKIDPDTVDQVLAQLAKLLMIEKLGELEGGVRMSKSQGRWIVTCGRRRTTHRSLTSALTEMCRIQGIQIDSVYETLYGEKLPYVL